MLSAIIWWPPADCGPVRAAWNVHGASVVAPLPGWNSQWRIAEVER
jgi:hypothetical protein